MKQHKRSTRAERRRAKKAQARKGVQSSPTDLPGGSDTMPHRGLLFCLFFTSGFTGLVYEVLWMKELGLLFGNTAHAAATTLAAFFLGLAAGGYVWGRRAGRLQNTLRTYALLEAGVAVTALLYFVLLDAYYAIYTPLFDVFGNRPPLFIAIKFALAIGVLFPPAFFMGGTLPVMSQHLVRRLETLGRMVPLLYGVNTVGAALGAYAAGFHLPPLLGFKNAYLTAIAMTIGVALVAWQLGRQVVPSEAPAPHLESPAGLPAPGPAPIAPGGIYALAFLSGFGTLSLEVLWTRMFAQVLQNSVYTFALILVTFLLCLALGAALASVLARRGTDATDGLFVLLVASALLVGLTPTVFTWATDGLSYLGGREAWTGYIIRVFGSAAMVMALPGVMLGCVFPFLMKVSEPFSRGVGRTVGDLTAINTTGAILGALGAGFVLLELFGLWASIRLMGAMYLLAAVPIAWRGTKGRRVPYLATAGGLLLLLVLLGTMHLPVVKVHATKGEERVYEVWEGSGATVAVVERQRVYEVLEETGGNAPTIEHRPSLRIKMNNYYTLGGTESGKWEEWQAHLPLFLHTNPRTVFFLGMGTGITAGAALDHPVERVVVTEIISEAVEAARKYFSPYLHGLFEDERASVVIEDGRNYLLGSGERFDAIIADLFMPWKAGTSSLYTREHYLAALARLKEGGLFAQWLPLHQMSRQEFGIIARTMLEVFPLVTLWRGDFFSKAPIVALVGHENGAPLDPDKLQRRLEQAASPELRDVPLRHFVPDAESLMGNPGMPPASARFLLYYCGNLSAARDLVNRYPLNTDDRPVIEYRAPVAQREEKAGKTSWFVGLELLEFFNQLVQSVPPERDPYLRDMGERGWELVIAGLSFYRVQVLEVVGDSGGAQQALRQFTDIVFTPRPGI